MARMRCSPFQIRNSMFLSLQDNAYDPDVGAKTLAIDVLEINNVKCLTFKDDGGGLDLDLLHKMLR